MNIMSSISLILFAVSFLTSIGVIIILYIAEKDMKQLLINHDETTAKLKEAKFLVDREIKEIKTKINEANIANISEIIGSESGEKLATTIRESVIKYFNEIGQEFNGLITDQSESMLRDVHFFLNEKVWDAIQEFKEQYTESPTIFPNNTRIAYTKGSRTIVLIEQQPQTRSILFAPDLVENEPVKIKAGTCYRYNLSFPYIYMLLIFDNNKFVSNEVYLRNKSINSIREHIYPIPLPNVYYHNVNPSVCMGNDNFVDIIREESTISKQSNKVVAEFWQRAFNGHLDRFCDGNTKEYIDKKIKNFSTWHQNTELDPLFILNINWKNGVTVKGVVERALMQRPTNNKLDSIDSSIKDLLIKTSSTLSNYINDSIRNAANVQMEEIIGKTLAEEIINKIISEHTHAVFNNILKEKT